MQVLSVRCGLTKNLGNYESAKLEIEASPSEGQTTADLLNEVKDYMEQQLSGTPANGKSKSDPPLRGNKANPTKAAVPTATTARAETSTNSADPPFDPDSAPNAEPGQPAPPKKRGRKPKPKGPSKGEASKELRFALESETLEELLERFNNARDMSSAFSADEWDAACGEVAECYRKLNSITADPETQQCLIAAFKAEKVNIAERRNAA